MRCLSNNTFCDESCERRRQSAIRAIDVILLMWVGLAKRQWLARTRLRNRRSWRECRSCEATPWFPAARQERRTGASMRLLAYTLRPHLAVKGRLPSGIAGYSGTGRTLPRRFWISRTQASSGPTEHRVHLRRSMSATSMPPSRGRDALDLLI